MKRKIIISSIIILFCLCGSIFCLKKINQHKEVVSKNVNPVETNTKTITNNGIEYYPKQNQKLILYMGINEQGLIDRNARQEDISPESILVIAVNTSDETYSILQLNYHTQADVVLSDKNVSSNIEDKNASIADAYYYGKDVKDQCLNIEATVSNYLTGIEFDNYLLYGTDALKIANDGTGGSTVYIEDDFSEIDPFLIKGEEINLEGDHVLAYLKTLSYEDPLTREGALKRQRNVFNCFIKNLSVKTQADASFPFQLFQSMDGYIQTDCSTDRLAEIFGAISTYSLDKSITLEGIPEEVDGNIIYKVDKDDMIKTCLDMFYDKK